MSRGCYGIDKLAQTWRVRACIPKFRVKLKLKKSARAYLEVRFPAKKKSSKAIINMAECDISMKVN